MGEEADAGSCAVLTAPAEVLPADPVEEAGEEEDEAADAEELLDGEAGCGCSRSCSRSCCCCCATPADRSSVGGVGWGGVGACSWICGSGCGWTNICTGMSWCSCWLNSGRGFTRPSL